MCVCVVSVLDVIIGAVCWGGGVNREGYITDLLHPHRSGWGDQNIVVLSVQHLLVHTLEPHCFGNLGLIVVVPAVGIPGQGGRLGEAAKGGEGRCWRRCCVGSYC